MGIRPSGAGFGLAVELDVHVPTLDEATAKALVDKAHQVCPYSNATGERRRAVAHRLMFGLALELNPKRPRQDSSLRTRLRRPRLELLYLTW